MPREVYLARGRAAASESGCQGLPAHAACRAGVCVGCAPLRQGEAHELVHPTQAPSASMVERTVLAAARNLLEQQSVFLQHVIITRRLPRAVRIERLIAEMTGASIALVNHVEMVDDKIRFGERPVMTAVGRRPVRMQRSRVKLVVVSGLEKTRDTFPVPNAVRAIGIGRVP